MTDLYQGKCGHRGIIRNIEEQKKEKEERVIVGFFSVCSVTF